MSEKMDQDEALAKRMAEFRGGYVKGDKQKTDLEMAKMLRTEVIDPAIIAGSVKMLKAHRNALYDAMPTNTELDAMDMLNIIQNHLANVDASIASLENTLKPVEVLEKEAAKKPLERMEAQEGEIVENENTAA